LEDRRYARASRPRTKPDWEWAHFLMSRIRFGSWQDWIKTTISSGKIQRADAQILILILQAAGIPGADQLFTDNLDFAALAEVVRKVHTEYHEKHR
jgi:hypothetical protein